MPAFFILVGIAIICLYFMLVFLYKPIGKFISRIFSDFNETISDEESEEQTK
nr:MAG TPA: ATP synthase B/B' [Caudoviricetes sp.]